ncbi:Rossmann-fold NAD(P)-binding domain-containing protein [Actinokineospora bangkokensis]|uniref:Short-chain dehydrogenase n=1 Tax=Actinokineospora bangkokensis TaxID=1193682 RepID=A0A1Q9LR80_9PSEU|nr:hypothetical protein [Actinokineospora bangkokensis]OLR94504.1 hypothetical protein BJP25_12220 [Actinokineospora bangkokensis]
MRALVIGGTGLLSGTAAALAGDGWQVVLPSRRPDPATTGDLDVRWVPANWSAPDPDLPRRITAALGGPADLLVVWAHDGLHGAMAETVSPLLADGAPVVEVHRGTSLHVEDLPGHPTHQVLLGVLGYAGRTRWLTDAETTEAILATVESATSGRLPGIHQIGLPHLLAS